MLQDLESCTSSLMATLEGSIQVLHTLQCLIGTNTASPQPQPRPESVDRVRNVVWTVVLGWKPPAYSSSDDPQFTSLLLDAAELLWPVVTHPHLDSIVESTSHVLARMLAALQQAAAGGEDEPRRQALVRLYQARVAAA
jgi:hypothetical protein